MCPCQRDPPEACLPSPDRSSPQSLIPRSLAHTASKNGNWSGALGRLAWNDLFATVVTQPNPFKSTGRLLHPILDRFVTVLEIARAQTFPDSFKFHTDHRAAMKQVSMLLYKLKLTRYNFLHQPASLTLIKNIKLRFIDLSGFRLKLCKTVDARTDPMKFCCRSGMRCHHYLRRQLEVQFCRRWGQRNPWTTRSTGSNILVVGESVLSLSTCLAKDCLYCSCRNCANKFIKWYIWKFLKQANPKC